ncbi:hypothetical protein VKT23_008599 [Stygiomarasmius scandens]|uniref:Uncharacterized protein n=1 Tax=Marasmiellus scandens TaxID=2682957 RepID=A0ABR1JGW7_9AGAR
MRLILNIVDLLMNHWQGKFECDVDLGDCHTLWDWAVLQGDIWKIHGGEVAACRSRLPGSFDCPPRNPAEKINSGYKAWEWLLYIFGLGPGLLYGILPEKYWKLFCKLVAGFHIMNQKIIQHQQLRRGHQLLIDFTWEYEELYYQRKVSHLYFCRQSVHRLSHLGPEVGQIGPPISYSQWTMEGSIGSFTWEIRLDSIPYANLSAWCVKHAQKGALIAMVPSLDPNHGQENRIPQYAKALGDEYILLHPVAKTSYFLDEAERNVLLSYVDCYYPGHIYNQNTTSPSVVKWSRLHLPNGQVARSVYKEREKVTDIQMAQNVKIHKENGKTEFGEVQYYFRMCIETFDTEEEREEKMQTLAMISQYSDPDTDLLAASSGTVISCLYQRQDLVVYPVKLIKAVVAMIPHSQLSEGVMGQAWKECVFVVEKPGLDVAEVSGAEEDLYDN